MMRRAFFPLAILLGAIGAAPAQAGGLLQDLFSQSQRPAAVVYHYAPIQPQMRFIYDDGLRVSRSSDISKKSFRDRQLAAQRRIAKKKAVAQRLKQKAQERLAILSNVQPLASRGALQPVMCCKHGEDPSKLIQNDKTLRVGDAYMTPQGLRIYRGRNADATEGDAFIDYRKAEIGQGMKARLSALEDQRARGLRIAAAGAPAKAQVATTGKTIQSPPSTLGHTSPPPHVATAPLRAPVMAPGARTSLDPVGRVIRVVGP